MWRVLLPDGDSSYIQVMGPLHRIPDFPDNFAHILCEIRGKCNVTSMVHACRILKPVCAILKSISDSAAHSDNRNVSVNAIREISHMEINRLNESLYAYVLQSLAQFSGAYTCQHFGWGVTTDSGADGMNGMTKTGVGTKATDWKSQISEPDRSGANGSPLILEPALT
jgi:hypothetical protein